MANQEQDDTLATGRQPRRSAATKNKSWSALMSASKQKDDEIEEEKEPSVPAPRTTPKAAPRSVPRKKQKTDSSPDLTKASEAKTSPPSQQAPRLLPSIPQSVKMGSLSNGTKAALGKNQIEDIELQKEMFKTYMSNESDEFSDNDSMEEEEAMMGLLDDEEYTEKPQKRTYNKRTASAKAKSRAALRDPPFDPRKEGISKYRVQQRVTQRSETIQRVAPRPIPTLKYASSNLLGVNENRPLKMVLLRPPVKSIAADNRIYGNGDGPRMPMTISSMSVQPSKELEEINKKFGDRIVPGTTVEKFNGLVSTLIGELKSVVEDRQRLIRNHEELTEQMTLSHSTALDIKDSRIRQLENYVDKLQTQIVEMSQKLQFSFSQHESIEKSANEEDESNNDDE